MSTRGAAPANRWLRARAPARPDIRVPDYIALVREGRPLEALALVHDKLPFAAFCGRACPHPCEQECVRNEFGAPISIMAIKRYAADLGYAAGIPPSSGESGRGRGPRVAIVGAGAVRIVGRRHARAARRRKSRCSMRTRNPAG